MEKEPYPQWRAMAHEFKRVDLLYCRIATSLQFTREAHAAIGLEPLMSEVTFPNPLDQRSRPWTFVDTTILPALGKQILSLRRDIQEQVPNGKGEELVNRIHGRNLAATELPDPHIHIRPLVVERTTESLAASALWTAFWQAKIEHEYTELQAQAQKVNLKLKPFTFTLSFSPDAEDYQAAEQQIVVTAKKCVGDGLKRIANVMLEQLFRRDPELQDEVLLLIGELQEAIDQGGDISLVLEPKMLQRLGQFVPALDLT